jgi:diaminopimelate decarboxylase
MRAQLVLSADHKENVLETTVYGMICERMDVLVQGEYARTLVDS